MIDIIFTIDQNDVYIDRILSSIAYQKCSNILNVYIVDIVGNKDYFEFIKLYSNFINIREIKSNNLNKKEAIQYAIDSTSSEYIVFINNNDCFSDSYALIKLYNCINELDCDCVFSNFVKYENSENYEEICCFDESNLYGKIYKRCFLDDNNIKFDNFHNDDYSGFNNLIKFYNPNLYYFDYKTYIWNSADCKETEQNYTIDYINVIYWAIEAYLNNNDYISSEIISELAYSTLYFIFSLCFEVMSFDIFKDKARKLYNFYKLYPLSEKVEFDIQEKNLLSFINKFDRKIILTKSCSFFKFLEMVGGEL